MLRTLRWFPDAPLLELRRDADELFGRSFGGIGANGSTATRGWTPAIEGLRHGGHYVIRVALPGVDPKDVDLSIVDNALQIKGERKMRDEVRRANYFAREFAYGAFERTFTLPADTDVDKLSAKWRNGILEVRVPMSRRAAPKKLSIEVGGSSRAAKAA